MADPITIIGTAGAIVGIIEMLGKTISNLRLLHDRWRNADFTLLNLISQLTALKAALNKIQEWTDTDMVEPHHQLVMDLEVSVACCRMLIGKMDDQISELQQTTSESLDMQSKIKLIFKGGTMDDLQKMVERQTNALTLLLTACNCKTIWEQKILLEKSTSREVFKQVRDDSSSLYVQRDTASFFSQCTDNLSKLSMVFQFDRELFLSKVYERAIRGSLKNTLRRQQADVVPTKKAAKLSKDIDKVLGQDEKKLRRECKVLLLGGYESGKDILVKKMMLAQMKGHTTQELMAYKPAVRRNVLGIMESILAFIEMKEVDPDEETKRHVQILFRELEKIDSTEHPDITTMAAESTKYLWARLLEVIPSESLEFHFPDSTPYFIEEIQTIAQKDYTPTESDVLRTSHCRTGVVEHEIMMGYLTIRLFDIGGLRSERRKWISQFEGVPIVMFLVNLSVYDHDLFNDPHQNAIVDSLGLFEAVVNSAWFSRSSIILLLSNKTRFGQKLTQNPLSNYFPDYTGGDDVNSASEYLAERFIQLSRRPKGLNLYSYMIEPADSSSVRTVFAAIQDVIIQMALLQLPIKRGN